MILNRNSGRPTPAASGRLRRAIAVGALALLGGCGGGTSAYKAYVPTRMYSFGDENSALTADGLKYSVNGFTTATDGSGVQTLDCTVQPIWVQSLASAFGLTFAQCNPGHVPSPQAVSYAFAGAEVNDIAAQIDARIAAGGFQAGDLVTVLAGGNDVIDLYKQYPARTEADLANELAARGKALALQVNRLVSFGAKVIVSTVPDMGLTPYALQQKVDFSDTDRAALLSRLTAAFNLQLGVNIILDGRYVGLVQIDQQTQAMVRSPGSFGLTDVTDAVCLATTPPPDCNTQTLVANGSASTWMWADDLRPAYSVQSQLATLAINRARQNPF
jgi:outer membrane lipase/esterase